MRLRWSSSANADLDAIQRYIAEDNIPAAGRMRTLLAQTASRLAEQPLMGRSGRISGTRERVVPRTRYILIYRVAGDVIEVLRVIHSARKWPPT